MTRWKPLSFTLTATASLMMLTASCAQPVPPADVQAWQDDADAFVARLEMEHENPFFHTPEEDFRQAVRDYKSNIAGMSRAQRIVGLAHLAAIVGDGHTWMPMHAVPFDGLPPGPGFRSLPIRFELFDDGLYVVGTTPAFADLLGGRVETIGHVSVDQAIAKVMTLLPQDATRFASEFAAEWLMQSELLEALEISTASDLISISVSRGDNTQSAQVAPLQAGAMYDWIASMDGGPSGEDWVTAPDHVPLWREEFGASWRWQVLDGVTYLQIKEIRNGSEQTLAEMAQQALAAGQAANASSIIIDLRRCSGGNGDLNNGLMAAVQQHLAQEPDAQLAVLTSRQTHSAAIMLVSKLEQQTTARFFGQATADRPNHHGETNIFVTPNSHLPIVHASEYYQTSTVGDLRPYRVPDEIIPYYFEDYIRGNDPVLAAARTYLTGEIQ